MNVMDNLALDRATRLRAASRLAPSTPACRARAASTVLSSPPTRTPPPGPATRPV